MAYMYQEEAGGGRGAELAEQRNTIVINTACNTETLMHSFIHLI
jgi:hypothetical protein